MIIINVNAVTVYVTFTSGYLLIFMCFIIYVSLSYFNLSLHQNEFSNIAGVYIVFTEP